ncbi:MAG: DUF3987 domain-containing protein [Gammaproteobacteria bacterium]|nr:DUF3987 domain-containing protein [Gammaproteobacteria bacterium]
MIQLEPVSPWAMPEPLVMERSALPYPIGALPPSIQSAVSEVQGFVQAPFPLVAASALSAISVAVQGYVDVQRGDRLSGPCGLFMLTIADSGERKSSCDGYFFEAIKRYQAQQIEDAKPLMREYRAEHQSWEAIQRGVAAKIQQLAKSGKPADAENRRLIDIQEAEPLEPKIPNLLYADATPEALTFHLSKNWPVGGVVSSEAGIVFGSHGMNSESVMRNLATYNELWSGSDIKIDRRTSASFLLQGARLSMGLMVQESPLRSFFSKSGDLARGSGFLARFLIAWPESTQGTRLYKEAPISWPALSEFNQRIETILNEPTPIAECGGVEPKIMAFTGEAKALWVKFHDDVEAELLPSGELVDVKDIASKAADNVARLACLFHVFENGDASPIGKESIMQAGQIVHWHLQEAHRFIGEMVLSPEQSNAAKLDRWLVAYCDQRREAELPRRTIQQYVTPTNLRKGRTLDAALERLADANRLAIREDGRKSTVVINPHLLNEVNNGLS